MSIGTIIVIGISLALGIVSLVLSATAGDAASQVGNADRQTLGDMQQTEQREGIVVSVIYGHATICGNMIWWEAQKMNTGSNAMYYRYKCWQTLCAGEINTDYYNRQIPFSIVSPKKTYYYVSVWMDEKPATPDYKLFYHQQDTLPGWEYLPEMEMNNGSTNINIDPQKAYYSNYVNKPYATRLKGLSSFFIGIRKTNNIILTSPAALAAGVTQMPIFKFCLRRAKLNKYDYDFPAPVDIGLFWGIGSNPAAVYYDSLVNNQYSGNIDSSDINDTSFQQAADYFASKKYGLNFYINGVTTIKEVVLKIQEWTDSYLVKDINNKYAIKILKDTDLSICTIDIDEEQVEFVLRRKSWDDTYNCFVGNYKPMRVRRNIGIISVPGGDSVVTVDCWKNEDIETLTLKNEANIQLTGNERQKIVDLTCFSRIEIASERLTQIMKKESYPYANATLTTSMKYYYLRVGDVITIDSTNLNVSAPFRIINVNYQKIDENKLTFELLQMRELLTDDYYHNCNLSRGEATKAEYPPYLENVTFPAFTKISNKLTRNFIDDSKSVVHWGTGQLRSGRLVYGTDYTVQDHNRIVLDENIFEDEIGFNGNGLLNIDVFEDIEEVES
jgi:hypothetical protein